MKKQSEKVNKSVGEEVKEGKNRADMKGYFKLPNDIFECGLQGSCFLVYVYLLSVRQAMRQSCMKVSYKTIAARCKISRRTAISDVSELEQRELLTKTERHRRSDGYYLANSYAVADYSELTEDYFRVQRKLFAAFQRPSDFLQACYHLKLKGKRNTTYPSLSQQHTATGLAVSTLLRGHIRLTFTGFLTKQRFIKRDGSFGHSRYSISKYIFDGTKRFTQIVFAAALRKIRSSVVVVPDALEFFP